MDKLKQINSNMKKLEIHLEIMKCKTNKNKFHVTLYNGISGRTIYLLRSVNKKKVKDFLISIYNLTKATRALCDEFIGGKHGQRSTGKV